MSLIKKREVWFWGLLFFAVGFLSRYFLAITNFSSPDSVQYAIGLVDFSLVHHTPPPPGYFLYLMTGKFLNLFLNDPQRSLVLVSIIYSGLLSSLVYLFGRLLFGNVQGIVAALLFLTSPALWYKGITIYGYLNSGFFLLLTAYFIYRVREGDERSILWTALAFGLCVGVRPQEFLILLPLYLYGLYWVSHRHKIGSVTLFGLTCFAWFVPLVHMSGGSHSFFEALSAHSSYLSETSVFGGGILSAVKNHLARMSQYAERLYFLGWIPLIYYFGRFFQLQRFNDDKRVLFYLIFLGPQLCFNVFMLYAEVGHGMAWALGLIPLMAQGLFVMVDDAKALLSRWKLQPILLCGGVLIICGFNVLMFFHDFQFDVYRYDKVISDQRQFNVRDAHEVDRHVNEKLRFLREHFDSEKLLIISKQFQRQIAYMLPKALVIRADGLERPGRTTVVTCQNIRCEFDQVEPSYEIPRGIETLVLFDDPIVSYLSITSETTTMPENRALKVLAVDVRSNKSLLFGYHSIILE